MRLKKTPIIAFALLLLLCNACNSPSSEAVKVDRDSVLTPVDLVYPQLDTKNSRWFFFASASRPFGMVSLSPDTKLNGTWGSGYRYEVDTIKGFSHIHAWQLSGLSVMPITMEKDNDLSIYSDYYSKFDHDEEEVSVGHHSLVLQRYNIKAELTSSIRAGFHKYTFPKDARNAILFNLNKRLGPCETTNGKLVQSGDSELSGEFVIAPTRRKPKANPVFFYVDLNVPIKTIHKDSVTGNYNVQLGNTEQPVLMKVGISFTSIENAKKNVSAELPDWDFDKVVLDSKNQWNDLLGRITVEGGTKTEQRRFYTDLWHALLGRKIISDVSGTYPDNTGDEFRIGQLPLTEDGTPAFNHYNSDAFWGAQWTISTLWGIAYPEIKKEFVQSLLQYEKDGGLIPRGPSGGNYTYVMTGASSTPFIVSAIQQGLITENLDSVYQKLKSNHMTGGIMEKAGYEHQTSLGGGFEYYLDMGYVPHPNPKGKFGLHQDGASLTMEYAYQDFALAQLANRLGYKDDYAYFSKRSKNYSNIFDSAEGWMRPKDIDGKWRQNFDPFQYESGFNESNGAQSTWFVPHDLEGLAALMGGHEKAVKKLNGQFEKAQQLGFTAGSSHDLELHPENRRIPINYGNQPSMQTAFIFEKLGRADLTQAWSRKVVDKVFNGLSPSTGYNGDEDQGLMGSLAVLMKIGIFQMDGGTTQNPEYQIGSPIFEKVTIQLNNTFYSGQKLEIKTTNNGPENLYVDMVQWNNNQLKNYHMSHSELMKGGTLELNMVSEQPF